MEKQQRNKSSHRQHELKGKRDGSNLSSQQRTEGCKGKAAAQKTAQQQQAGDWRTTKMAATAAATG
jgi:hypothetical protein